MNQLILYGIIAFALISKIGRCIITNIHREIKYLGLDTYEYFKEKKWNQWNGFGLNIYVGMFGRGKTLSATKYVLAQAKRYKLNIISNIKINGYPYTPLTNWQQIVDAPGNTIILIDEMSTVFNARAWKDFNINLLFQLLQCRKNKKMIIGTAQRFAHVDKLLRDITYEVIDCNKLWRLQHTVHYDGWDYENCMNHNMLQRTMHEWKFITNIDYKSYDTSEIIDNAKRTDFISNDEIMNARGEVQFNELAITKGSRKFKKRLKNKK